MTIWILACVVLASLAALGYRQGAIRVAFSFLGIVIGALLAVPLGHKLAPLIPRIGVKNPVLLWLLPALIVYVVILTLFKVAGGVTHKKVEVFYKYKAGDLRLALWERLIHRLGLCLGLANATAYLSLICFVIYALGYWTVQLESPDANAKSVEIFNRVSKDLESTGMAKVAGVISELPPAYYDAADITGLIYQNPQLVERRLSHYPALLSLEERPEFQAIANDTALAALWQQQASIKAIIDIPTVRDFLHNPDTLVTVSNALVPNLQDLRTFLETDKSPKFDSEKILGRWDFNANNTIAAFRRARPNITSSQMQPIRLWINTAFAKTTFIAAPDQQAYVKNLPSLQQPAQRTPGRNSPPPPMTTQNVQGRWKNSDGQYELTLTMDGKPETLTAVIENDRLTINVPGLSFIFDREY